MPESPLSLDDGKQRYIYDLFQLVAKLARFTEMMNLLQVTVQHLTVGQNSNCLSTFLQLDQNMIL